MTLNEWVGVRAQRHFAHSTKDKHFINIRCIMLRFFVSYVRTLLVRGIRGGGIVLGGLVLAAGLGGLSGCMYYGFSGASIPSHLETVAIPIAEDNTSSPVNDLGNQLTNRLTDQFVDRTRLSLDNNETNADALLTARIVQYSNRPTGVSGDERATSNQVQVDVQVRYYDQVQDSTMVDQRFSGSADYDPTQSGVGGERQAAQLAVERVADDIFTSATSNW